MRANANAHAQLQVMPFSAQHYMRSHANLDIELVLQQHSPGSGLILSNQLVDINY